MGQRGEEWNPDLFNLPGKERHGETHVESSSKGRDAKQAKNRVATTPEPKRYGIRLSLELTQDDRQTNDSRLKDGSYSVHNYPRYGTWKPVYTPQTRYGGRETNKRCRRNRRS